MTDCMTAFRRIHPLVKYELYSGNADNISDSVEHGLLDMGLMLDLSMGRLN